MRLVLASANPDKAAEIAVILQPLGFELEPRPASVPDVEEHGETLEDNARLKAIAICEATGQAAVADDTGLEVDALGGAPGARAARFAGEHATYAQNVTALVDALVEVSDPALRTARFRSVAMVRFPDGREVAAEGVVSGRIAFAPIGTNGFGYDPVFVPDGGDGRTLGQLDPEEKHAISHRGRAFRALAAKLKSSNPPT
jgi:XTP/dITP diphosphohydrolase